MPSVAQVVMSSTPKLNLVMLFFTLISWYAGMCISQHSKSNGYMYVYLGTLALTIFSTWNGDVGINAFSIQYSTSAAHRELTGY